MVFCALAIITGLGCSGIFVILPMVCEIWSFTHICNTLSGIKYPQKLVFYNNLLGIFVLFNIYFNYIMAMRTDPGTPDKLLYGVDEEVPIDNRIQYRQCKKCNVVKPPRAHHCSVCERCTLRMDHHCPWVSGIILDIIASI